MVECDPDKCSVEKRVEKSDRRAPKRSLWCALRQEWWHSVAHFRVVPERSASVAREPENARLGGCAGSLWRKTLWGFKFPLKRENTGNFADQAAKGGKTALFSDDKSATYAKILYAPELGNFLELTGNISRIAGKVAWLNLQRMGFSERTAPKFRFRTLTRRTRSPLTPPLAK